MLKTNKNLLKTMQMQIKGKFDYQFKPNIGVGNIGFNDVESYVIDVLGEPVENSYDEELETRLLNYFIDSINISFFFSYENRKFSYNSIHIEKLYIDSINIFLLGREELINHLKGYYKKLGKEFKYKFIEDDLDDSYEFDNIGLTVWYEKDKVSDICVNPIFDD